MNASFSFIAATSTSCSHHHSRKLLQLKNRHVFGRWLSSSHSINAALKLLNLTHRPQFNRKELRDAYFSAAKLCHPDSKIIKDNRTSTMGEDELKNHLTNQFHAVSEAYELLQKHQNTDLRDTAATSTEPSSQSHYYDSDIITKSEEQHFREACVEFLGVDAEIVEESKRCPLFREWLKGRTVDAFLWNSFLMKHGGLAPMLRKKKTLNIAEGDDGGKTRRRRRK